MDVAALSLTLPVVAHEAFTLVVLPFVFAASLTLVVLFLTPFRDIPFIAQHATRGLTALRTLILLLAVVNILLEGYTVIEALSFRWIATTVIAVLALATMTIDLRRAFP